MQERQLRQRLSGLLVVFKWKRRLCRVDKVVLLLIGLCSPGDLCRPYNAEFVAAAYRHDC